MIYIYGSIGFIGGFALGLFVISFFLKNKSNDALKHEKALRWTYGLAVWVLGALGAWAAVFITNQSAFTTF